MHPTRRLMFPVGNTSLSRIETQSNVTDRECLYRLDQLVVRVFPVGKIRSSVPFAAVALVGSVAGGESVFQAAFPDRLAEAVICRNHVCLTY